jgi:hypothetical protein
MVKIEPKFQKRTEFSDDDLVCYCFEYTKRDIEHDYSENGKSRIYEKIALEKKAGRCNCASKNPKSK